MGQRCPTCARIKRGMLKRNTFQCVKRFIENEGYKLISKEYKNAHTKLQIKCPEEHRFEMKFNAFQQGQRCPECAIKRNNDLKRFDYKDVKNYIESFEGYKLLSEEYIGSNTKLKIQCSEGHIFKMTFACFKNRGQRCPKCFGNKRLTNQEIIDSLIFCENIRENKNEEVEVTCAYCGEWFIPKRSNLTYRILYVNGEKNKESRLYCSQQCKDNCPTYNQKLYPKDFKPATSREVQPQLRQMVFERDNYTCQRCNTHKDELECGIHCHHILPLNEDPIQSADVDTCITYCENCHKWIHQNVAGCGYGEMRCV
jgi:hypothetical protein